MKPSRSTHLSGKSAPWGTARPFALLTTLAALGLAALPAHAQDITYYLQDVTFTDGGTASGQFTLDTQSQEVGPFDITVTAGSLDSAYEYCNVSSGAYFIPYGPFVSFAPNLPTRILTLAFSSGLPSSGTDFLSPGSATATSTQGSGELAQSGRAITSGYVTTDTVSAPEPSSMAAFAFTGLGVIGLIFRARKRKAMTAQNKAVTA